MGRELVHERDAKSGCTCIWIWQRSVAEVLRFSQERSVHAAGEALHLSRWVAASAAWRPRSGRVRLRFSPGTQRSRCRRGVAPVSVVAASAIWRPRSGCLGLGYKKRTDRARARSVRDELL